MDLALFPFGEPCGRRHGDGHKKHLSLCTNNRYPKTKDSQDPTMLTTHSIRRTTAAKLLRHPFRIWYAEHSMQYNEQERWHNKIFTTSDTRARRSASLCDEVGHPGRRDQGRMERKGISVTLPSPIKRNKLPMWVVKNLRGMGQCVSQKESRTRVGLTDVGKGQSTSSQRSANSRRGYRR